MESRFAMKGVNKMIFLSCFFLSINTIESQVKTAVNALWLSNKISTDKQQLIHQYTKYFPNNSQLAFAFINNKETSFYGVKRTQDTLVYYKNEQSTFEIASITKVFTANLLSDFVINEKLKLTDDINQYLDFKLNNSEKITFEQLANHTSGLPRLPSNLVGFNFDRKNPYKYYNDSKLETYLKKELLLIRQGGTYVYSNLGYGILDYTLRKVSNKSYEQLLQEKIFSKYEMHNSTTILTKVKKSVIQGLNDRGEITPNWSKPSLKGSGSIFSTAEDLSKFVKAHFYFSDPIINLTKKITYIKNNYNKVGLGWHIKKNNSNNFYWHNGGSGGYSTILIFDQNNKKAIIILCNLGGSNKEIEDLAWKFIKFKDL